MTIPLTITAIAALAVASGLSRRGSTNKSTNLHLMEWWAKQREQLGTMSGDRSRGLYDGAEAIAGGADPATVPDAPVVPFSAYFEAYMQDGAGWRRDVPDENKPRFIDLWGKDPRFPYAHRSEQIDPRPPPRYSDFTDAISGDIAFWVLRGHGPSSAIKGHSKNWGLGTGSTQIKNTTDKKYHGGPCPGPKWGPEWGLAEITMNNLGPEHFGPKCGTHIFEKKQKLCL